MPAEVVVPVGLVAPEQEDTMAALAPAAILVGAAVGVPFRLAKPVPEQLQQTLAPGLLTG